jgi:hypothetical protein
VKTTFEIFSEYAGEFVIIHGFFLQAKASALKDIIAEIDEDGKKRLLAKFSFLYSTLPPDII